MYYNIIILSSAIIAIIIQQATPSTGKVKLGASSAISEQELHLSPSRIKPHIHLITSLIQQDRYNTPSLIPPASSSIQSHGNEMAKAPRFST
jgi:hypothetical protein